MTTTITFVPSGAPVSFTATETSTTFALPTVDGSNTDMMVSSTAGSPVFLTFGAAVPLGDTRVTGEVALPAGGQAVLLTATQATASAGSANPLVVLSANHATATSVAVVAGQRGRVVTVQRGTATPRATF
jgi:hypothetical protein